MGMTREERVKAYVEQHPGSNAQDVAEALGLHRSGVSADLNRLYRKGILVKQGKRPVRFYPAGSEPGSSYPVEVENQEMPRRGRQPDQDGEPLPAALQESGEGKHKDVHNGSAFGSIIGSNGSIKAQIQLAKAAVAYPPYGLHTLITGETGVGKSLLAEAMWRYGVSINAFGSNKHGRTPPFVVFSCAEYADNPQLLLAQLFGYVKGAFTGANENRPGLVERAQGGILFLDEIHRLPPTGQELLFRLIDKGQFRRIGEMQDRSANLMIIGATTETPSSVLLSAFRRRIPVHIELPRLEERPVSERLSLIAHFLLQEANRLGLPVQISGGALKMFMCFDCVANIGDLKNTLQLCCAKGYLSLLSDSQPGEALAEPEKGEDAGRVLKINIEDVPQRVYERMQNMEVLQDPRLSSVFNHGFLVQPGEEQALTTLINDYELPVDLYGFVQKRLDNYRHLAFSQEEIEERVGEDLERYFSATVKALHRQGPESVVPPGIVAPVIWSAATLILTKAADALGLNYSRRIMVALALHLQQFVERAKSGQIIYNPHLKRIKSCHSNEYRVIDLLLPRVSQLLGVEVPEDEAGFLAMFLTQGADEESEPKKVGLVVVAQGDSTATSVANTVNHLLDTDHIKATDAPLTDSWHRILESLAGTVAQADEGKGVLILADIGSLGEMERELSKKTGVAIRIIPYMNTTLVLEAGRAVLMADRSLSELTQEIEGVCKEQYKTVRESMPATGNRGVIMTVCPTGAGTATKIRDLILDKLSIARTMDVIPVSALEDIDEVVSGLGDRLCVVVGSIDPEIDDVPFVGVDEILSDEGLKRVERLLKGWDSSELTGPVREVESREDILSLIRSQMHRFVSSVTPEEAEIVCDTVLRSLENEFYARALPVDLVCRVYLHTACMVDRIASGNELELPAWGENERKRRKDEFAQLKQILDNAGARVDLKVPESEIDYFLAALPSN